MSINHTHEILNEKLLFLDSEVTTKRQVIEQIAQQAFICGYISDTSDFIKAVLQREEEVPTAIGYQIAIPHGKSSVVKSPFIAFLRSKEKFQWTQGYDEEVRLVFLIGVPSEGTETLHLKFISQVSKKLLDEEFRQQLTNIGSQTLIFEHLCSIEI